jgi:hypothetical protein
MERVNSDAAHATNGSNVAADAKQSCGVRFYFDGELSFYPSIPGSVAGPAGQPLDPESAIGNEAPYVASELPG